jgi:hypothetical protein
MKNKNTVYGFICFTEETPQGQLTEPINIEVFAENEPEATKKVLELTGRKEARLKTITEICEPAADRPLYVCTIQGFTTEVGGQLVGIVQLDLWENEPKKALDRAKTLVEKKFYRFRQIVEKLPLEK